MIRTSRTLASRVISSAVGEHPRVQAVHVLELRMAAAESRLGELLRGGGADGVATTLVPVALLAILLATFLT